MTIHRKLIVDKIVKKAYAFKFGDHDFPYCAEHGIKYASSSDKMFCPICDSDFHP